MGGQAVIGLTPLPIFGGKLMRFKRLIGSLMVVGMMAFGVSPAFAAHHVDTPNHCQEVANGKDTRGNHTAHEKQVEHKKNGHTIHHGNCGDD